MATALRGEVCLQLHGRAIDLRPTFAALVAAEAEVGSLFQLLDRAAAGDVRIADLGAVFWHCAAPAGQDRDEFEAALVDAGVAALLEPYQALLRAIFGRI